PFRSERAQDRRRKPFWNSDLMGITPSVCGQGSDPWGTVGHAAVFKKESGTSMKRATAIPLILLVILALAALLAKGSTTTVPTGGPINPGDVAWMLTASALVLLMTPGL